MKMMGMRLKQRKGYKNGILIKTIKMSRSSRELRHNRVKQPAVNSISVTANLCLLLSLSLLLSLISNHTYLCIWFCV